MAEMNGNIGEVTVTVKVGMEASEQFDAVARMLGYVKERTCHNTEDGEGFFRCSKCGCCVLTADEQGPTIWLDRNPLGVRYCPNCWARVVEVER